MQADDFLKAHHEFNRLVVQVATSKLAALRKAQNESEDVDQTADGYVDYYHSNRASVRRVVVRDDGTAYVSMAWPACGRGCCGTEGTTVVLSVDEVKQIVTEVSV